MNRVRSGFFGFKRVKSYVLCMGVANIHVKKNQGLAFHRTGDRPEALLCPIVMKSVTNKTSENVGLFFLGRLTNTQNFPWNSIKKIKNKKVDRRRELIPAKHSADLQSVTLSGVLHAIESLFSKFSDWANLPGRAQCGCCRM